MLAFSFTMEKDDDNRGGVVVVLILDDTTIERLKAADPLDIQFANYRGHWDTDRPLGDVDLIIAYEQDKEAVKKFAETHDLPGLMAYIERGRTMQPGDGEPPKKVVW